MPSISGGTNNVTITVTADGKQAVDVLKGVEKQLGNVSQAGRDSASSMRQSEAASRGLADSVKSLIGFLGTLQLSLSVIRESRHLLDLASDFQQLEYAWKRFVGTSSESQDELKWVEELGSRTYGIANLTRAMVDLAATGIKPTRKEMEGFLGYLMSAGKTSPQQFHAVIDRITALFQLGPIGMEDALKELTEHIPFLMTALREKMNMSVTDMYMEFIRRGVDFSTIIRSVFEYAGKNFQSGLRETENFWDVLINRMRAKREIFERELMRSGAFQGMSTLVSGWVNELDDLERNGTLSRWAVEVGDTLEKIGEAFGLKTLSVEKFGESIVSLSKNLEFLEGSAKAVWNVLTGVGTALETISNIVSSRSALGEAATYGIIGKFLFGTQAGLVISALSLLKSISNEMNKLGNIPDPFSQYSHVYEETAGGPAYKIDSKAAMEDFWKWYRGETKDVSRQVAEKHVVYEDLDAEFLDAKMASERFRYEAMHYFNEVSKGIQSGLSEVKTEAQKASDELAEITLSIIGDAEKKAEAGLRDKTRLGVESPLASVARKKLFDITTKINTQIDQMFYSENLAGKTGFERWQAEQLNRMAKIEDMYVQQLEQIYAAMESHKADNRILSIKEDEELLRKVTERYVKAWESYHRAEAREKEYWDKKEQERAQRGAKVGIVDSWSVDQDLLQLRKEYDKILYLEKQIGTDLMAERASVVGDVLSAEMYRIEKETGNIVQKLDQESQKLSIAVNRFYDKVFAPGKKPTAAAVSQYEQAKAILADFVVLSSSIADKAQEIEYLKKWEAEHTFWQKRSEAMARASVDAAKLAWSSRDLLKAEEDLAAAEAYSLWLQARKSAGRIAQSPPMYAKAPWLTGGIESAGRIAQSPPMYAKAPGGGGASASSPSQMAVHSPIQVSVHLPAGGVSQLSVKDAHGIGEQIGKAVRAEFVKMLEEQMRPGNALNRGLVV